jgi:hypothetical protein
LLFAGYLKQEKSSLSPDSDLYDCLISIPNHEVFRLYSRFFREWLSSRFSNRTQYESFLDHLISGNVPLFVQKLGDFLIQSVSVYDTHSKSEGFYHGFVLALIAILRSSHYVRSNRESGYGRYDVLLIPIDGAVVHKKGSVPLEFKYDNKEPVALLLEFKHARKEEELESSAKLALDQIQNQSYRTELLSYPYVKEVVEVGIAFSSKAAMAAYAMYDLVHKKAGVVNLTNRYGQEEG